MYARTTLFEIDTMRISVQEALARFQASVLPRLREQPGYCGVLVMDTPEGRGMLLSLWDSQDAADSSLQTGFYDAQVSEFLMVLRQPPGREHYDVIYEELAGALTPASDRAGGNGQP